MGLRINIRLNSDIDSDIIEALSNAKNVTLEVKKLLRLGINVGKVVEQLPKQIQQPKMETGRVLRPVEQEQPVGVNQVQSKILKINEVSELEANLLSSFGFDDDEEDEE